ncbi:MAG: PfkB family carbohydrate kinase [Oceanipulchritudo sp.]
MTLTGNLLAEWTFVVGATHPGETHRAKGMDFQVGGKGINVSRVLRRLGEETEALGFANGPLADQCTQWLGYNRIPHRFFPLGETGVRPGFVIREKAGKTPETTFLGQDKSVPDASWKAAFQYLRERRPGWLALCGSIPGWRPQWAAEVRDLLQLDTPVRLCVDTYGPPLRDLAQLPLDAVKINRSELDRLIDGSGKLSTPEAIAEARSGSPVRTWIITDGSRPVIAGLADGVTYSFSPASILEQSPTGSGDTFLAALLHRWRKATREPEEAALAFATACATSNASSPGIGDFPMPVPERFYPEIERMA